MDYEFLVWNRALIAKGGRGVRGGLSLPYKPAQCGFRHTSVLKGVMRGWFTMHCLQKGVKVHSVPFAVQGTSSSSTPANSAHLKCG